MIGMRIHQGATCLQLFLLLSILHLSTESLRWLALNRVPMNAIWNEKSVCSRANGLSGRQVKFCKKNFQWMKPVYDASLETKDECMEQFKDRKWNCLSISKAPNYDNDLSQDTKEAGFLYALSSATLALKASSACLSGTIPNCKCSKGPKQLSFPSDVIDEGNLSYIDSRLGCKGIVKVGRQFSSAFMSLGLRRKPKSQEQVKQLAVHQHNILLGMKLIDRGEEVSCVCNGATAGCVVKYCYRRLVQVQEVSEKLLQKYDRAERAEFRLDFRSFVSPEKIPASNSLSTHQEQSDSILYLSEGDDHCRRKVTSRRPCVIDEEKPNSCKSLCCGRGYKETVVDITSQCDCKFIFCCRVECQTCLQKRTIYECL